MKACRGLLALVLVFCLFHLSLLQSVSAATAFTPSSIRQRVDAFGVGAHVGLKLAGGKKLRGVIQGLDEQGFLLSQADRPAIRIAYAEVGQLTLTDRAYHAKDRPDPVQARRVVLNLGVGRHAVVRTAGREFHGHIQNIDAEHFTLLPDREAAPVEIAYADVQYVEKNLSFGATVVLVVLIAAALIAGLTVAATH